MAKVTNIKDVATEANDSTLVLQELKKMQEQIRNLTKENEEIKKNSRVGSSTEQVNYEGPMVFSLKLWNDKIVCDYSSKKKEANKDLTFKNQYGEWIDNQVMTLVYDDGTTEDVMSSQFGTGLQKTNKVYENGWITNKQGWAPTISKNTVRKVSANGDTMEFYVFDVEGKKVEVCSKCVN